MSKIEKIVEMIEQRRPCPQVAQQLQAVESAIEIFHIRPYANGVPAPLGSGLLRSFIPDAFSVTTDALFFL